MQNETGVPSAKPGLIGPRADVWLAGGASLLLLAAFHLFTPMNADVYRLSVLMYGLSMVVNWPHFMLSYLLLYRDRRRDLLKKPAYFWAGVVVPFVLINTLLYAFMREDNIVLSMLAHLMFLTVGWHYVKQVFGTMVVSSAAERFSFSGVERGALLTNLYSLWALSFLRGQTTEPGMQTDFYGIRYELLGLTPVWWQLALAAVIASGAVVVFLFGARYLREGRLPSVTAIVAYVALYAWYLPVLSHPHFVYVIPFFHSVQYLLFVGALKKNQWTSETHALEGENRRRSLALKVGALSGSAILLGLSLFLWIPTALDGWLAQAVPESSDWWGPTAVMASFQLFINIHHYFIDNVIWKRDNPDVREHLVKSPRKIEDVQKRSS